MRTALVGLLGMALLLAGCAGPDGKTKVQLGDGTQIELADANVTATQGSVSGVVVDEAIRPIGGVNITVLGGLLSARSNDAGLFVLEGLEPGLYTLTAQADGYTTMQTTVEAVAGTIAKVRIVLPIDATPRPYHVTYAFDWFDDAGQGFVDFAIDLVDESFLNDSLPNACTRCRFFFDTDPSVHTLVIEATWEDAVGFPAGATSYYWSLDSLTSGDYESDYFQNPGYALVSAEPFGNETHWAITLASDENWITLNQQAQLYVTVFYLAPPPEGWSIVAGST